MRNIFTEHPKEVGETYFQHFRVASKISLRLLASSAFQFVHAFFPFVKPPKFARTHELSQFLESVCPESRKKK
jgi:hypothetical protein